ncbi:TPA: hypothetical protein N0F65_010876, partial [Lagenidium giganteum]
MSSEAALLQPKRRGQQAASDARARGHRGCIEPTTPPPRTRSGSREDPATEYFRMGTADPRDPHERSATERSGAERLVGRPSLWRRLCCCVCCCFGRRQYDDESVAHSHTAGERELTPEQLLAQKQLKKQIAHYSTMRVHMKRVQLCLEQEKRNKFYKELLVYFVFLVVVMCSLLSLPVHFPYEQNAALDDLFFDEEFRNISIKKTFHDVMVEDELWQWVEGPFIEGFYELPIRNNRRIMSVMVRTGRVQGDLCRNDDNLNDLILFTGEMCYPEFSTNREMRESYGNSSGALKHEYDWKPDLGVLLRSQTFNPSLFNHQMDYGKGGYAVYLPRDNEAAAREIVKQLKDTFLTESTRYMVINFSFFNPRSNIFTFIQALFEMSDTDYMETTARVKSFRIFSHYKDAHFVRDNIFLIVLILATFALIMKEIGDVREHGIAKYIHSLWNILDMLQLVLLVVFIERWITYLVMSEQARKDLLRVVSMDCSGPASDQEAAAACYVNLQPIAWVFSAITDYAAALALVSVAIVFKYLRLNTRLNLLWRTLRFAAKDLLAFVVIFFTMFFGFAVMGFLLFGSSVRQYHSLSTSLTSCFQMLLGAFDYNEMYDSNPAMAGLFFFSFMISIYLICVNMFIAIMSEYYSVAQAEKKQYEENKRNLVVSSSGSKSDEFTDSMQFADVEYDLAKQIKAYMVGLRLRVRLPPKVGQMSPYTTDQVPLCGDQRVMLIDYNYYMAERKRLRAKFRSCVHTVITCAHLMRTVRPEFTMEVAPESIPDRRRRAMSASSFTDIVDFPVTYVPIASSAANPIEILKRLKRGMFIDMDDGSLTKDQITLEVLGGQDEYLPPQYTRRDSESDDMIEVRVGDTPSFGLRHRHAMGDSKHIRVCRVLYNGDTVLDGMEACLVPRTVWARYFSGFVFWGAIKDMFSFKKKKRKSNRLISDAEVDRLITETFAAPGRGISCRFDELVRNFRMFVAKKVHRRHMRISNLEDRIFIEVITFLERFPSALSPLDKREFEGYKYTPQPVDTKRIRLPNSIHLLSELLSQNAHEVWAVGRIEQGWRWGPSRDNEKKLHPDLIPYEELTEETKQYDRDTSMAALKVITALGYVLEPPDTAEDIHLDFGLPASEPGGTYEPRPIPTDDVKVPPHLRQVIELLAENTHEVWAEMRMSQGWKYGPQRNDAKKEHNGLVPYIYLTNEEKQMDRNTAMQTVKLILRCGFTFVHKDKINSSRNKKSRSGNGKVFGRSENVEPKNVGDAVTVMRGTNRAKRAFLKRASRHLGKQSSTVGTASQSFGELSSSGSLPSSSERSSRSLLDSSIVSESSITSEDANSATPPGSTHAAPSSSKPGLVTPRLEEKPAAPAAPAAPWSLASVVSAVSSIPMMPQPTSQQSNLSSQLGTEPALGQSASQVLELSQVSLNSDVVPLPTQEPELPQVSLDSNVVPAQLPTQEPEQSSHSVSLNSDAAPAQLTNQVSELSSQVSVSSEVTTAQLTSQGSEPLSQFSGSSDVTTAHLTSQVSELSSQLSISSDVAPASSEAPPPSMSTSVSTPSQEQIQKDHDTAVHWTQAPRRQCGGSKHLRLEQAPHSISLSLDGSSLDVAMRLSPREEDHLVLHQAGALAQKRLARGVRLNYTESVALLATQVLEFIRDGKSVAELMTLGAQMLGRRQVMDGVPEMLDEVQVEGTFPDGTKLVTVHHPISRLDGDLALALYGSFLPVPALDVFGPKAEAVSSTAVVERAVPGEIRAMEGDIVLNAGRPTALLQITNLSDRPIQVGSHYHLIETNPLLEMDRRRAYGFRLNIASGTAIRFEPGDRKTVPVVPIGGNRIITGGNGLATGVVDVKKVDDIVARAVELGFHHRPQTDDFAQAGGALGAAGLATHRAGAPAPPSQSTIPRSVYAQTYGPTTGDVLRLGDMELFVCVEHDFTVYGDERKFGGGKVLREGMGQMTGVVAAKALDTIITNALVIDYTGIYKADIGIRNGLIAGIGKGGNPDVMDGVTDGMIVGVNTEVIAGEGLVLTAGGLDTHVHFICPQLCTEALASGLTTLVGGGTGPATGTNATTCTPGPNHIKSMLQATDEIPINIGLTGKGNSSRPEGLQDAVDAGAVGLKLHEDWGTTPAAIDACMEVAELNDIQVTIHTDTLNESSCVEHTIAAFRGRTIHTYHSEGAGGGHAPDIITVCGVPNVIPSSTNPTRPFTRNTIDEHVDMLMVCHHLDKSIAEDVAFAESRIRGETIAAEDVLHDMGAISIISSDSQAMGRIGEVIARTWQTANKM